MAARRVLFVHGAAGDARVWAPVIAALPPSMVGEAIDLAYHGPRRGSAGDGSDFGTRLHRDDLIAALEAGETPAHVVGWSYSCHVVFAAMLARPELFASILCHEPSMPTYVEDAAQMAAFHADFGPRFAPVFAAVAQGDDAGALAAMCGEAWQAIAPARQAIYLDNAATLPLLFGGGEAPMPIRAASLAACDIPACITLGDASPDTFAVPARAAAGALASGRLQIVAGAGHFLPELQPARFAHIVGDWTGSPAAAPGRA
ncbi:alpha/beta fold hydrolase [Aurantiacibacter luteus]|uniref:alpha/beta fold hydrolase n=1 Tax=Aurantiacibacter luteus TaxID=1581420 RepID=UPI00069A395B|nr:alpha/beta hydrolase [Aurantiacibacter luteus]